MTVSELSPPTALPLSVAQAKAYCRADGSDEDSIFTGLIRAAVAAIESEAGRFLVTRTAQLNLPRFPYSSSVRHYLLDDVNGRILLPKSPVWNVTGISYLDGDQSSQTWSSSEWSLRAGNDPDAIEADADYCFPSTYPSDSAVTVTYQAGYAAPVSVDAVANTITCTNRTLANGDRFRLTTQGTLPTGLSVDTDYYAVSASGMTCQVSATLGGGAIDFSGGSGQHFMGEVPPAILAALQLMIVHLFEARDGQKPAPSIGYLLETVKSGFCG